MTMRPKRRRKADDYMMALAIGLIAMSAAGGDVPNPKPPVFTVRPHGGIGATFTPFHEAAPALTAHAGVRALLPAGPKYRYGLEVSFLALDARQQTSHRLVLGVMLETILFGHFLMGIGTVGYISASARTFGVSTNLGWEPQWRSPVLPFVTVRTDFVFAETFSISNALSLGLTVSI